MTERVKNAAKTIEKVIISIEKTNISIEKVIISIKKLNIFIEKVIISIEKTNISIEKMKKLTVFSILLHYIFPGN